MLASTMTLDLRNILKYYTILLLFLSLSLASAQETITLVADRWPPFNAESDSNLEGYIIDIARNVFEKKGYVVHYLDIPWKRAGYFDKVRRQ